MADVLDAEEISTAVRGCEIAGSHQTRRAGSSRHANAHPGSPAPGGDAVAASCSAGARQSKTTSSQLRQRISVYRSMPFRPPSAGRRGRGPQRLQLADRRRAGRRFADRQGGHAIGDQFGFASSRSSRPGPRHPSPSRTPAERTTLGQGQRPRVKATLGAAPYTTVQVASKAGQPLGSDYEVTGTVCRNSAHPVTFANCRGHFYDKGGNVGGGRARRVDGSTISRRHCLLQHRAPGAGAKVAKYSLVEEAQVVNQGH